MAFLGDYIYENGPIPAAPRQHTGTGEPYTLAEYRDRYAQYKADPDLQAAHAAAPWVVTLDDHEIDNNWAGPLPPDPARQPPAAFRARRAAAFQAYCRADRGPPRTWVCDLRTDFDDPSSPVVGAELTGISLTSGGHPDPAAFHATYDPIMAESPHWKYADLQRGYVLCDVTPERMVSALRVVDTIWLPSSPIRTSARFLVEAGVPGVSVLRQEPARTRPIATPQYPAVNDKP